ncbi:MAG: serine hydrolase [Pyrinomonadaceae bacterium]|nr:serine hydrolase [Pyrinomonadaceae bacterium]
MVRLFVAMLLGSLLCVLAPAQKLSKNNEVIAPKSYQAPVITNSTDLQAILKKAVHDTLSANAAKNLKPEEVAATLIDLRDAAKFVMAEVRGEERIYSASVVKMYYMAALERQLEDGKILMSPELQRGLRDMIVDSSNEATQYILDVITGTSSGAELPQKEFDAWQYKRNRVNRWFSSMGYTNINVNQKTFCEDAYGIEQQSRGYKGQNRNMLTTNATARLLAEIVTGRMNTPERTSAMMDLMKRDPFGKAVDGDDQNNGFTGKLFIDRDIRDVKLWSKAGWTSKTRHDAAYVETADGLKFVLVIFTENHANEREIIPGIAGKVLDGLKKK